MTEKLKLYSYIVVSSVPIEIVPEKNVKGAGFNVAIQLEEDKLNLIDYWERATQIVLEKLKK